MPDSCKGDSTTVAPTWWVYPHVRAEGPGFAQPWATPREFGAATNGLTTQRANGFPYVAICILYTIVITPGMVVFTSDKLYIRLNSELLRTVGVIT
jgi:hypothetical protein